MISRGITGLGICTTFRARVERMTPRGITGLGICTPFGVRVERMTPRGITGLGICTTFGARVEGWITNLLLATGYDSAPSSHFSASNTRAGS